MYNLRIMTSNTDYVTIKNYVLEFINNEKKYADGFS